MFKIFLHSLYHHSTKARLIVRTTHNRWNETATLKKWWWSNSFKTSCTGQYWFLIWTLQC